MNKLQLIDTHCHLYLDAFKGDISAVLSRAEANGVGRFYLPSIDSTVVTDMLTLESYYPEKCKSMIGLHPCSVKENCEEELQLVDKWLQKRRFPAIGEIGLDYYWDRTFVLEQHKAFKIQIRWANDFNIPIVIHSRNSLEDCIKTVRENKSKDLTGIFHCFSGTESEALKIIDIGFFLGIGGVLTYKNAGLAEVIKNIPLENLVLETDAPYLAPVPFRGKRNESSYLKYVAEKLALLKEISVEEVAIITTRNANKIFGQEQQVI